MFINKKIAKKINKKKIYFWWIFIVKQYIEKHVIHFRPNHFPFPFLDTQKNIIYRYNI